MAGQLWFFAASAEALDEPWNKHIRRPKSLGLYKAVETNAMKNSGFAGCRVSSLPVTVRDEDGRAGARGATRGRHFARGYGLSGGTPGRRRGAHALLIRESLVS